MKALFASAAALFVGLACSTASAGNYRYDTIQSPYLPVNRVMYQPYLMAPAVVPMAPTVTYYAPGLSPAPAVIYGPAPVVYPSPVIVRRPFAPRRVYVGW